MVTSFAASMFSSVARGKTPLCTNISDWGGCSDQDVTFFNVSARASSAYFVLMLSFPCTKCSFFENEHG